MTELGIPAVSHLSGSWSGLFVGAQNHGNSPLRGTFGTGITTTNSETGDGREGYCLRNVDNNVPTLGPCALIPLFPPNSETGD